MWPGSSYIVLRQQVLLHFAERVARQLIHQDEGARHFERCQLLAADGFQVGRIDRARHHHVGHGNFATHAIGRRCNRGFGNALLFLQELFDLPGIDVEAAGDDQVALTAA